MRILLTGGTGMVGRNILDCALGSALQIHAPSRQALNLLSYEAVREAVKSYKPDVIIHAAGYVGGIQANMAEPVRYLVDNLDMGRNVVMAAKDCRVPRLINLASSCMYPRDINTALTEDLLLTGKLEPTNEGYALAKNMVTRLCQYVAREDSTLQYKTLIPCNLYGRYDKFDPKVSHVLPAIISKIHLAKIHGEDTVEIWGDGTARREFLYASDLANCILRVVENFESVPDIMNVGTGTDYTINEYYQTAAEAIGFRGRFTHDLSKPVGMMRKLMSIDKVTEWGWAPTTSLLDGIRETYEYHRHAK